MSGQRGLCSCCAACCFCFISVEMKECIHLISLPSVLWTCLDNAVRWSQDFSFAPAQVLSKCRNFEMRTVAVLLELPGLSGQMGYSSS